jgi:archaellum component FlaG (FlaF/FlaG flagellin family)
MKTNTVLLVAAVASVLVASPYVFGLLTQNTLNTSGVMADVDIGVYSDSASTEPLSSINWGTCYTESNSTVTVYIKNLGTVDTVLSIATDNWTPPSASTHYILYASCDGYSITAGEILETTFNLYPKSTASQFTAFSFDIIIQGQD